MGFSGATTSKSPSSLHGKIIQPKASYFLKRTSCFTPYNYYNFIVIGENLKLVMALIILHLSWRNNKILEAKFSFNTDYCISNQYRINSFDTYENQQQCFQQRNIQEETWFDWHVYVPGAMFSHWCVVLNSWINHFAKSQWLVWYQRHKFLSYFLELHTINPFIKLTRLNFTLWL